MADTTPAQSTAQATSAASPDAPKHRSFVWHILKLLLPLVVIAALVYVVYNFPALQSWLRYWLNPPGKVDTGLLPSTTYGSSVIPIQSGAACGKPIPYDNVGNPKAICDNYIYIPKIRVAAPIVEPSSTADDAIKQALLAGVIHYPGTAQAGQRGNVFLTGHSSYYWWVQTDYRNVFTLLPNLDNSDEIIIYRSGVRYTYKVTEKFEVRPNQVEVLQPTQGPVVTLSTCVPIGTDYRRVIVRGVQVSPDPAANAPAPTDNIPSGRLPGIR